MPTDSIEAAVAEGRLGQAVELAKDQVKRQPSRLDVRTRLFQLFCLQGEWDRAQTQLQLLGDLEGNDGDLMLAIPTLMSLIQAEKLREHVLSGRQTPVIFGTPPPWMGCQIEGLRALAEGRVDAGVSMLSQAWEQTSAVSGRIDGVPFHWIVDADSRFGAAFEAVIQGNYYWVPFLVVERMELSRPENLHDRIWLCCNLTLTAGSMVQAYLPARYPGTTATKDEALMLVRETAWEAVAGGLNFGRGQRFWATDQADYPLLKVSRVEFDPVIDEVKD